MIIVNHDIVIATFCGFTLSQHDQNLSMMVNKHNCLRCVFKTVHEFI